MADEIVIGKIGLTPKGGYVSGELYDILDMVSHEGNSYVSKIQNNNVDVTNTEAWLLAATKGGKGDKGDTFDFEDLTTEQKEELKGDVIAYNSLDEADKDDLASRVPITGVVQDGNTQAVSGGEVFQYIQDTQINPLVNKYLDINNGVAVFSSYERLSDNNGGVDGVVATYVENDGTFPLTIDNVPNFIRHTASRPTEAQYTRSTFLFTMPTFTENINESMCFGFLIKRAHVNALANQERLYVRPYQDYSSGQTVVDLEMSIQKQNILIQGYEVTATSNGVNGKLKVLEVDDNYVSISFVIDKLRNSLVSRIKVRLGLSGLIVSNTERVIEYFNFFAIQSNNYHNAKRYFFENQEESLPTILLELIEQKAKIEADKIDYEDRFIGNDRWDKFNQISIFEDTWTGGVFSSEIKLTGDTSLKVTSVNNVTQSASLTNLDLDIKNHVIFCRVWIEDYTKLNDIQIRFCRGNWNNRFMGIYTRSGGHDTQYLQNGWNDLTFHPEVISYNVTKDDLLHIDRIRIDVRSVNNETCNVFFDQIGSFENPLKKGVVSITFDDGYKSLTKYALPYMSRLNMRGVAYVCPAFVDSGQSHFATVDDLKELDRAGWDIGNHTYNHYELPNRSLEEVERQFKKSINWFGKHGFSRAIGHLSYPKGASTPAIREIASKYFVSGRISSRAGLLPTGGYNVFPLINNYQINVIGLYPSTAMTDIKRAIDDSVRYNIWVVLMFHGLEAPEGVRMDLAKFYEIIDYVNEANANVKTFSDLTPDSLKPAYTANKVDIGSFVDSGIAEKGISNILVDDVTREFYKLKISNGVPEWEATGTFAPEYGNDVEPPTE